MIKLLLKWLPSVTADVVMGQAVLGAENYRSRHADAQCRLNADSLFRLDAGSLDYQRIFVHLANKKFRELLRRAGNDGHTAGGHRLSDFRQHHNAYDLLLQLVDHLAGSTVL